MRYYRVVIRPVSQQASDGSSATVKTTKSLSFTTHPNGVNAAPDMGAMHIIMDVPVSMFDQPNGMAYLEIRGVDIQTISQASNLQGATISIYGGMGKGFPLCKPEQSGLLISGSVAQAYGNWQNTEMSLNLLVQPFTDPITDEKTPPLVWHWQKGKPIKDAINLAITTAMSGYTCDFTNLKSNLTAGSEDAGFYDNFSSIAQVILTASQKANPDSNYMGVRFYVRGKTFFFYDTADQSSPTKIDFNDMVGQPTWLGPDPYPRVMFQTVMRADITLGDVVSFPAFNQNGSNKTLSGYGSIAPTGNSAQYMSTPKNRSMFQGNYMVTSIRHIGDSRNPNGEAWVTTFEVLKV